MVLSEEIRKAEIDFQKLEKGLKHIGLNVAKFEAINSNQISVLIELFKIACEIDPKLSSRYTKMDLRIKLEHILKNDQQNQANSDSSNEKIKNAIKQNNKLKSPDKGSISKLNQLHYNKQKLGKVKFYDHRVNHFGIITGITDKLDYRVSANNIKTLPLYEDDVVIYDVVTNLKGKHNATKVSKNIPVFIFQKDTSSISFAYPLIDGYLSNEITLSNKMETGFAVVYAKQNKELNWGCSIVSSETLSQSDITIYGKQIILHLLTVLGEHISTVAWLINLIKDNLEQKETESIYKQIVSYYAPKTIIEIDKAINNLNNSTLIDLFIEQSRSKLNKLSFVLWHNGKLEKLPNANNKHEIDICLNEIWPTIGNHDLQQILLKLLSEQGPTRLIKESYKYLIARGWDINSAEELRSVTKFIDVFKNSFPSTPFAESNFRCNANRFYIDLYNKGLIQELSDTRIKQNIEELKSDYEKASFIEKLPTDKILSYYFSFPSLSNYQEKYISGILENEFSKIDFLCFDLESDGEKIMEFAFKDNTGLVKSEKDFESIPQGVSELITALSSGKIVVGHNIKHYDIPILEKIGLKLDNALVWDTLEIEFLLNPCRFSYGLKTAHNATDDTLACHGLFYSQILRLGLLPKNSKIFEFIPEKSLTILESFGSKLGNYINTSIDPEKLAQEQLRPTLSQNILSTEVISRLTEEFGKEVFNVVIAPAFLWDSLSTFPKVYFSGGELNYNYVLNKTKVEGYKFEKEIHKVILKIFIEQKQKENNLPYWRHLPVAIQMLVGPELYAVLCDGKHSEVQKIPGACFCVEPDNISAIEKVRSLKANFIYLGRELQLITSKHQLGEERSVNTIFDKLKNEDVLLKMSGGRNYAKLSERQCQILGITLPPYVQNVWMEKFKKGSFKVWCNTDSLSCFNGMNIKSIPAVEAGIKHDHAFIVRSNNSGYSADQYRLNPESLNRAMYWTYQLKIISELALKQSSVLLVNDTEETNTLIALCTHIGFYIPDQNATLARQVELLHESNFPKKLIIQDISNFTKILNCNYSKPLNFIWESFLLYEKNQMLGGELNELTKDFDIGNTEIDIEQKDGGHKGLDMFGLIKAHKPLVNHYASLISLNHPESTLHLIDTRLTDFYGIENGFNINAKKISLWRSEAEYLDSFKNAKTFFKSEIFNEVKFDLEEAKQILANIFLRTSEESKDAYWYPYQLPYLDDILPAKKDLLISLPTGAGKSLLFQGPALYRSTFSNKLNIVVTPLRALMQDQVEALWDKGFISNVDFLSGDKSQMEIRDIYRRVAGGELTLLYITPERFRSKSFEKSFLIRLDSDSGLEYAIFDEAHCISQWGQEFRPDYLYAGKKIAQFASTPPYEFRKLLFSATISEQVFEEITTLIPGINAVEGTDNSYNPVRDHISINFKRDFDSDDRLTEVAQYFKRGGFNPKLSKAIVFVKSRKKAEEGALLMPDKLKDVYGNKCEFANNVGAFHAGMDVEDRKEIYEKYKSGEISILFATKAFGMGMDIPDIHFLSHYSPPGTFEDFLQEIGRAGRNEKKRTLAGFNNTTNPIKAFCLADTDDFKKLKDQHHKSRITWEDIKSTKALLEKYISKFKPLVVDNEMPVAVPFTLASLDAGGSDDDADNKFRIALHWLEKLGRVRLGYFTITHLDVSKTSVKALGTKLNEIADEDVKKVCSVLYSIGNTQPEEGETLQVPISTLRSDTKFGLEKLFKNLLIAHKTNLIELRQEIAAKHTEQRTAEVKYSMTSTFKYYTTLDVAFNFAEQILSQTPLNDSRVFEGDVLEQMLQDVIAETVTEDSAAWIDKANNSGIEKNINAYKKDLITKRSKHAFTIIRLLGTTKHESKLEKTIDSNSKIFVKQSLFNGYKSKDEWRKKLKKIKEDCSKLLNIISRKNIKDNQKKFNWADLIRDGYFPENLQYVSDLFFILSVLGYIRTSSLLPSGIETYITSLKSIDENIEGSTDKSIYEEFNRTNEIRELKLIAMQALSGLDQSQHDEFIKKYFACNSLESLINMLQNYLPETDPVFQAFRGEAIKEREEGLNKEQRIVYDAAINQNINVIAGPGSGKTHTLSLRVAKLVHHIGILPDEILVLAYNRAVVSELKDRLGKLFNDLGYSNIAKRLKIFTFHGMAKRYCKEEIGESDFNEWEDIFLDKLNSQPGIILNQLGKIKHILVDEFQDINDTRMEVLSKLIELTDSKIFIIGDPNQSIYGYDRNVTNPYHYYDQFNKIFKPTSFTLLNNHRSYPDILKTAARILKLPAEHANLIPIAIKKPDDRFIKSYVEIYDLQKDNSVNWVNSVQKLLNERHPDSKGELNPYRQIAVLFRSNNEVYKGYQSLRALNLNNVRIRIQGGLQYEFTRLRECFELIEWLKSRSDINKRNLVQELKGKIAELVSQFPNWNHFYLQVMHAIVLDYFEQDDEKPSIENLIEFITELSYKDDGQLYKIYEKHLSSVANNQSDTEIVLTTMHKVKGLEFDAVITVPSVMNLGVDEQRNLSDQFDEERRLAFVSYTRAKYRLIIFIGDREHSLIKGEPFEQVNVNYGLPVEPKLNKHVLNNNAKEFMFVNQSVNDYIRSQVKVGDLVSIQTKRVSNYTFKELIHAGKVVGSVSVRAVENLEHIESAKDFVVNEVVTWSFNDTKEYDERNNTNYQKDWCNEAKQKGFIYIVDFAGFCEIV